MAEAGARVRLQRLSPIGNRRNPPPRAENAANFFRSSARAAISLVRELRLLERRTHRSGKDTVEHPRNGHDDYANVVCGVLSLLAPPAFEQPTGVMSEAMDVMLKIGITERRIRNPHCTQAAQQCRLWPCPRTAQKTEAYGPSVSLQWQAVGSTRSSSRTGNAFFAGAISFALIVQLRTYRSASHLSFEAAQPRTTCGAQAREDVQCSAHL